MNTTESAKRFSPEFGALLRRRRKNISALSLTAMEELFNRYYIQFATLGSPNRFHDQPALRIK